MPSIRYLNQSAPFWDFVANFENQFGQPSSDNHDGPEEPGPSHPPPHHGGGPPHRGGWHRGPMPHHPHHHHPWGPPPPHHGGPPHHPDHKGPPPPGDGDEPGPPPPDYEDSPDTLMGDEKSPPGVEPKDKEAECSSGESGPEGSPNRHRRGGRCGRRGRCHGGRGRHPGGPGEGPHHHRGHSHGRRGGPGGPGGPWGRHRHGGGEPPHHGGPGGPGGWGGMFAFPPFAGRWMDFLSSEFGVQQPHQQQDGTRGAAADGAEEGFPSFTPEADVFDTPAAFVLHIPLPGAQKDDVSVSWDAELSEITVGGVLYRRGDEEFLKTLALDERKVGAFERKVRLGSRANPAVVDVEGISAKLEDGVLVVEVPKVEAGFVEVRKVDIE